MWIKKILGFGIGPILSSVVGFVLVPYLTNVLTPDIYGQYSIYIITTQLVTLVCLAGYDQGFVREYHESLDKSELLTNALFINVILFIVIVLVAFQFRAELSLVIFDEKDTSLFILMIALIGLSVFYRYIQLFHRMEEFSFFYSILIIIQSLSNAAFIIFFIELGSDTDHLAYLVLAHFLSILIPCCWGLKFGRVSRALLMFQISKYNKEMIAKLSKFSIPLLWLSILMWVLYSSDQYMMKWLSSLEELGIYVAAYKLCAPLSLLQVIITTYWTPLALRWHAEDKDVSYFENVLAIISLIMIIIFSLLLISKDFIILILGSDFKNAVNVFPLLLFFPICYTLSEVSGVGVTISRRTKFMVYIGGGCVIINVTLNFMLIPYLGALGAAISTACSFVVYLLAKAHLANILWKKINLGITYGLLFLLFMVWYFDNKFFSVFIAILAVCVLYRKLMLVNDKYKLK